MAISSILTKTSTSSSAIVSEGAPDQTGETMQHSPASYRFPVGYGYLWLWDFSLTCESEDSLDSCECTFAEELMDLGLLSCDDADRCPQDCAVCSTCMRLLGCLSGNPNYSSSRRSNLLYLLAAALGIAFFGVVYYTVRKRQKRNGLGAHLMDDQEMLPNERPQEPIAWLAPETPPAQFEPSNLAAVASSGESTGSSNESLFPTMCPVPQETMSPDDSGDSVWLAPMS